MSSAPQPTPYELIGGEAVVRRLVHRFYQLMDELPEAHGIRKLHPADLSTSEQKLFEFFSGWLGGPPLFEQRRGPVFLRRRHLPFAIAGAERDQWLMCMRLAMDEVVADVDLRGRLFEALAGLADHMRNQPEPP
jgi:hemoglobin